MRLILRAMVLFVFSLVPVVAQGFDAPAGRIHLPVDFVSNHGQWPEAARFRAMARGVTAWCHAGGWALADAAASPTAIGIRLEGLETVVPVGLERSAARYGFLGGAKPGGRIFDTPGYQMIEYRAPARDVAVRFYGDGDRRFRYDVEAVDVKALERLRFRIDGAQGLELGPDGCLLIKTARGIVRQTRPVAWWDRADERLPVSCEFHVVDGARYTFRVAGEPVSGATLVVDPGFLWFAVTPATGSDWITDCAVFPDGQIAAGGFTSSADFPVSANALQTSFSNSFTHWVGRFDPDGTLNWATYLTHAAWGTWLRCVDVDHLGRIIVSGGRTAGGLPVTPNAYQATGLGGYFALLDPDATGAAQLAYATYFSGSGQSSSIIDVLVSPAGTYWLAGIDAAPPTSAPVAYGPSASPAGGRDAFVAELDVNAAQQLRYFTFLGGTSDEDVRSLARDGNRFILVGATPSADFPTTSDAQQGNFGGREDGFLAVLDPTGPTASQFVYSTLLGGAHLDAVHDVAVNQFGNFVLGGITYSSDFPGTGGYSGGGDAFYCTLDPSRTPGAQLVTSILVGGANNEGAQRLLLQPSGAAVWTGPTSRGRGYPITPGAPQVTSGGSFLTRLGPDGVTTEYATYVGIANSSASVTALATLSDGDVLIGGAYDRDVFLARADLLPVGATRVGHGTAGCDGVPQITVTTQPRVGVAEFAVRAEGAEPFAGALVGFAAAPRVTPLSVLGAEIWIELNGGQLTLLDVVADALGTVQLSLPIPATASLVGESAALQAVFADSCALGGLSATAALTITIQP